MNFSACQFADPAGPIICGFIAIKKPGSQAELQKSLLYASVLKVPKSYIGQIRRP
jgi:hypothetical protein